MIIWIDRYLTFKRSTWIFIVQYLDATTPNIINTWFCCLGSSFSSWQKFLLSSQLLLPSLVPRDPLVVSPSEDLLSSAGLLLNSSLLVGYFINSLLIISFRSIPQFHRLTFGLLQLRCHQGLTLFLQLLPGFGLELKRYSMIDDWILFHLISILLRLFT